LPPEDDVCSVCHDRFRIPCQANCSHWFCGKSPSTPPLPLPPSPLGKIWFPFSSRPVVLRHRTQKWQVLSVRNGFGAVCLFLLLLLLPFGFNTRNEFCWF
jgi:hypothetical protein